MAIGTTASQDIWHQIASLHRTVKGTRPTRGKANGFNKAVTSKGDDRNRKQQNGPSNQPVLHNDYRAQQNNTRPWLNRSNGWQQRPNTGGNRQPVRAYHGESTEDTHQEEQINDEVPYDDLQEYQDYEEGIYQDVYWTGPPVESTNSNRNITEPIAEQQPTQDHQESTQAYFTYAPTAVDCWNCHQPFESKNKLHQHLRTSCSMIKPKTNNTRVKQNEIKRNQTPLQAAKKHPHIEAFQV
ncbi:MAG: hypothetical protein M1816_004143 [Peltula sp. TS41687]|nr:MAG: hypothetical protein M1816_004143 [Peltula sp. TS41687]